MEKVRKVKSKKSEAAGFAFHLFTFAFILCALVLWLGGCQQPGETMAEGHRRHLRNVRINQQELVEDIDKALLADKPSRLTDKRIP